MNQTTRLQSWLASWDAAWNHGNLEAYSNLLSPKYVRHGRTGDQDRMSFETSLLATRTAFPALQLTVLDAIETGDRHAIRWHSSGVHQAPFHGIPATGRTLSFTGMTFVRFDESLVAEEWAVWDDTEINRRIGVIRIGPRTTQVNQEI
ncbi:hypothetical protein BH686_11720 [Rhodococcus erythropolis]|uniref:ester cyclase n=1 Tax=Rhodococcus erythropolis TaxID=1833 RepID=UPI000A0DBA03|nr:ester cyclase [Rhodococcus erythropolis]ORI30981.1 hypothetical protein BH686_11720 [Rhodococcus erythropolis]